MKCLMKSVLKPAQEWSSNRLVHASLRLLLVANVVPLLGSQAAHAAENTRANDFPTTARVEYVLECMKKHDGKYEYMYKCSCAVDEIGKQVPFDDYVEISTALRHQTLGGQRGAEFRDPEVVKNMARRYKQIEDEAADACFIK